MAKKPHKITRQRVAANTRSLANINKAMRQSKDSSEEVEAVSRFGEPIPEGQEPRVAIKTHLDSDPNPRSDEIEYFDSVRQERGLDEMLYLILTPDEAQTEKPFPGYSMHPWRINHEGKVEPTEINFEIIPDDAVAPIEDTDALDHELGKLSTHLNEFTKRYDEAVRLAEYADAHPEPDSYYALIGYYNEFGRWLDAHGKVWQGKSEQLLRLRELNDVLLTQVDKRIKQLLSSTDKEELAELGRWRELWQKLHTAEDALGQVVGVDPATQVARDTTLHDMLAKEGLRLRHGKNEAGEDVVWTEPIETPLPPPPPLGEHGLRHSHWEEVVDLQDELIRFWYTEFGAAYGRAFGESILEKADPVKVRMQQKPGQREWTPEESAWALELHVLERTKLQLADPMYVNEEVQQLIWAAATHPTFELEPLRREDVYPTLNGFVLFPAPFYVIDKQGRKLAFRAVSWCPYGADGKLPLDVYTRMHPNDTGGLMITGYTHRDDPDDFSWEDQLGGELDDLKIRKSDLPIMSLCYVTPWSFTKEHMPIDMTDSNLNDFCKIVQTMWRMAAQTITTPTTTRLPKAFRKRAERKGLQSDVVVVRLRKAKKPKHPDDEPIEVEWSCRWAVRGHWRNQWYPKLQEHKQIWVSSYTKGPEDKPFVVKPLRAYELIR